MNPWQLASTRCQQAAAALGEFKKLVYDSKFTKLVKWMSFINSKRAAFPGLAKQDFGGSGEVQLRLPSSRFYLLT